MNVANLDDLEGCAPRSFSVTLFRSELSAILLGAIPSFDQQIDWYGRLVRLSQEPPVIRLFDFGEDKEDPSGENISHLRGIRYLMSKESLLNTQLHAILRAAKSNRIRVLIPGVTDVSEIHFVKDQLARIAHQESRSLELVSVGCMIEFPAAVSMIQEIAQVVDFVALGTNDLSQFIFGRHRHEMNQEEVMHPALLRVLSHVCKVAYKEGVSVSVCGELAGNPMWVPIFLGMRVRVLSISPDKMGVIKSTLSQCPSVEDCQHLVQDLINTNSQKACQERYALWVKEHCECHTIKNHMDSL